MHAFLQVMGSLFSLLDSSSSAVAGQFAQFACRPLGSFAVAAVVVTSLALAAACAAWAIIERIRLAEHDERMRVALRRSLTARHFRDALLEALPEAVVVLRPMARKPLSYRGGSRLLRYCLDGPDAAVLAAAIDGLLERSAPFTLSARTLSLRNIAIRGVAVGDGAALFLRAAVAQPLHAVARSHARHEEDADAAIVIGRDGRLRTYNPAFARQWRLQDDELRGAPQLADVVARCVAKNGYDPLWNVVIGAVMTDEPERFNDWNGRGSALHVTRLPDGGTQIRFGGAPAITAMAA